MLAERLETALAFDRPKVKRVINTAFWLFIAAGLYVVFCLPALFLWEALAHHG